MKIRKKKHKRLIPFTTGIITSNYTHERVVTDIKQYIDSDSCNPYAQIFIIEIQDDKIQTKRYSYDFNEGIEEQYFYSYRELIYFLKKLKLSVLIDFAGTKKTLLTLFFSNAGITFAPFNLMSIIFADKWFRKSAIGMIKDALPHFFNIFSHEGEFGRKTKKYHSVSDYVRIDKNKQHEAEDNESNASADLGNIPVNSDTFLLWYPEVNPKRIWKDFVEISYIAEKENHALDIWFENKKLFKKFSSDFYVKGRKREMDSMINFVVGEGKNINEEKNASMIIFSSSRNKHYKRIKKTSVEKLTTISKWKKANKEKK